MSVLLAVTAACLFGIGTWLLLQRRLTRIIIGLGLIGHGTNILLITSGGRGGLPPLIGRGEKDDFADPLPQALALTAIVITFGVMAFLLAMAYRSWQVTHDDLVADDLEDRLVGASVRLDSDVADVEAADLEASSDSSADAPGQPDDEPAEMTGDDPGTSDTEEDR
ncbi:MAG: NADH-quinone oxidoreductase subunit K [Actinomycetota bacterium]